MIFRNNIRNKIFYCTVLLFLINLIVGYSSVYAASNPELENKALATSVANCTAEFEEDIKVQDFISAPSNENASRFVKSGGMGGGINGTLPNGFAHGNCAEFLDAVMNKGGKTARISNAEAAGTFLKDIGYKNDNGGSSGECAYFNYYTNQNDKPEEKTYSPTRALCAAVVNSDGTIGVDKLEVVGDALMVNGGNDNAVQFETGKGSVTLDCSTADFLSKGSCETHTFKNGETNWRVFVEEIQNDLLENNQYNVRAFLGYTYYLDSENPTEYMSYGDTTAVYSPESSSVLKEKSMGYFVGKNYTDDELKFSKAEKFVIYQNYLKEFFGADVQCDWNETQITANTANGYKPINFYDGNTIRNCYAKGMKNTSEKVNGIDDAGKFTVNSCDYNCVATWLAENKVNAADLKNYDIKTSVGILRSTEEVTEGSCREVSGAKGLGWILCPILEWMGGAATGLYDGVVGPLLSIDPKLFNNNETNNTTEEAWETFRNIANVIFIILFLVVIFSQLTGVGIDNYGIKKILPRLIVAAVMINLSYILCILLVDISNIFGSGLRGIFEVLGNDINPTISMDGVVFADGNTTTTVAGAIAGVSLFGLLAGGIGVAIFGGAATLLSLFVSGIGVIISIVFMFLLLSVREAAIVVFVVISPLAVVAYMLPNTKKLFDKWWKLFEGLLLVYPIAGMLVGAGNYASKLLLALNPNDFFSWITAMVVGIVPIFFIPMVLKGTFSAMGKVGGMLTGLGGMASKKAKGTVRSSDAYKNAQNRMRAGLDRNGNLTRFGKLKTGMIDRLGKSGLSKVPGLGGAVTGLSKSQAAQIEQAKKNIAASEAATGVLAGALATTGISKAKTVKLGDDGELTQEGSYYADSFFDAARRNDITGMNAAIEAMRNSNMKAKDISRVIRYAQNEQMFNGIDSDKRSAWYRDLSKKYGNDFLSTDYELSHFMRTGGSLSGGKLGNYGQYAADTPIDADEIRPEDLTKLSGDSLAGMAAAGKISQSMAQRVLESNPNISEDKKIMFGAIADGRATGDQFEYDGEGRLMRDANGKAIVKTQGSINRGGGAVKFKQDAKTLMQGGSFDAKSGATIETATQDDVRKWASATAQSVKIVGDGSVSGGAGTSGSTGGAGISGSTGGAGGSGAGTEGVGGDNSSNNVSVSGVGDVYTSGSHTFTRQANGRWTDENGNMMGGYFSARINSNPAAQQQIRENARKSSIYTNMSDEKIVQLANSATSMNGSKEAGPSEAVIRSAQREANRRGLEFGSSGQNK